MQTSTTPAEQAETALRRGASRYQTETATPAAKAEAFERIATQAAYIGALKAAADSLALAYTEAAAAFGPSWADETEEALDLIIDLKHSAELAAD